MTPRQSASRSSASFSHPADDTVMRLYLRDISRYKPLSSADEYRCAVLIRAGDRAALEKLVRSNLRFVVSVARNYQNQGMFLSDLINEGNLGLVRAARRFDERKNFKFISYAVWWIRQGILQALANHSRPLRFPLNRVSEVYRIQKTRAALEQKLHRSPNSQEIAGELGISEKAVTSCDISVAKHASLDAPVQFGSNMHLMNFVHSENHDNPGDLSSSVVLSGVLLLNCLITLPTGSATLSSCTLVSARIRSIRWMISEILSEQHPSVSGKSRIARSISSNIMYAIAVLTRFRSKRPS